MTDRPVTYASYLDLDRVLRRQQPVEVEVRGVSHGTVGHRFSFTASPPGSNP